MGADEADWFDLLMRAVAPLGLGVGGVFAAWLTLRGKRREREEDAAMRDLKAAQDERDRLAKLQRDADTAMAQIGAGAVKDVLQIMREREELCQERLDNAFSRIERLEDALDAERGYSGDLAAVLRDHGVQVPPRRERPVAPPTAH